MRVHSTHTHHGGGERGPPYISVWYFLLTSSGLVNGPPTMVGGVHSHLLYSSNGTKCSLFFSYNLWKFSDCFWVGHDLSATSYEKPISSNRTITTQENQVDEIASTSKLVEGDGNYSARSRSRRSTSDLNVESNTRGNRSDCKKSITDDRFMRS